jgi:hypothetical protein
VNSYEKEECMISSPKTEKIRIKIKVFKSLIESKSSEKNIEVRMYNLKNNFFVNCIKKNENIRYLMFD